MDRVALAILVLVVILHFCILVLVVTHILVLRFLWPALCSLAHFVLLLAQSIVALVHLHSSSISD